MSRVPSYRMLQSVPFFSLCSISSEDSLVALFSKYLRMVAVLVAIPYYTAASVNRKLVLKFGTGASQNSRDADGKTMEREIVTHRNTWNAEKTEKHKVVEAFAVAVIAKETQNPVIAKVLLEGVQKRLNERAQVNRIPTTIPIYDKGAKAKAQGVERTLPQIQRNTERTR